VDDPAAAAGAVGYRKWRLKNSSQKIQKSSKSMLTRRGRSDYIRPTNEGGAPLAAEKFASTTALAEQIQESRVSDTRRARKAQAKRAKTLRLWCLFFDN
jgi:hypothetical protein